MDGCQVDELCQTDALSCGDAAGSRVLWKQAQTHYPCQCSQAPFPISQRAWTVLIAGPEGQAEGAEPESPRQEGGCRLEGGVRSGGREAALSVLGWSNIFVKSR